MTITPNELKILRADPRWEKNALLWKRFAGVIWTGGNVMLLVVAGLNKDPVLAAASIGTITCGLLTVFLGDKNYEPFAGPGYVGSSIVYTSKHLFNAVMHVGSTPLAEGLSTAFGAGCTTGLAIWFFGKEIKSGLDKIRPVERLSRLFPQVDHGTLGRNIINGSYLFVASGSVTSLAHGIATANPIDIQRGVIGLTMLGLWVGGDFPFARYANIRDQILRDARNALPLPAPNQPNPSYSAG
jgi:hypothetical protein